MNKVSVIIPNYNHARYLSKRIESVLNQSFSNLEILLLDDCSKDNSRDIIEYYSVRDSRIKVIINEQNSGSTFKQWNKGIKHASGEYIWLAESDDYAHPHFLATLVAQLDANSEVGIAYCDSIQVDENDDAVEEWKEQLQLVFNTDIWQKAFVENGREFIRQYLGFINVIPNASAVLLRRSVLTQIGPADENMRLAGDWLYWLAIASCSDIAYFPNAYNYFRTHTNNVRSKTVTNGILLHESARALLLAKQVAGTNAKHTQAIDRLVNDWFAAIIYGAIPRSRHLAIMHSVNQLHGDNGALLLKKSAKFLFENKLRGLRMLLGDGIFYRYFRK